MNRNRCRLAISLSALVLVAGCGGGGTGGGGSAPQTNSISVGPASLRFRGKPQPLVTVSSAQVTVAGLSGAAFSSLTMNPAPLLANTEIAYIRNSQVWVYSLQTHSTRQITHIPGAGNGAYLATHHPSFRGNGQITFESRENSSGNAALYAVLDDGTGLVQFSGPVANNATWSPDGSKVAGLDSSGNFVVMNYNGTNPVTLDTAANLGVFNCSWINATTLVYPRLSTGYAFPNTIPVTGGAPTILYQTDSSGNYPINPYAFPNGTGVAIQPALSTPVVWVYNLASEFAQQITPTGYQDSYPAVAPDNATMAVYRTLGGTTNDGISGIYTMSIGGDNAYPVDLDPSGSSQLPTTASDLAWSPFQRAKLFVGTSAPLGAQSSGFLLGESANVFTSLFSFNATTPSTATITPSSSVGGSAPLVFTISANAVTSINYTNGYYYTPVAISPGTGITGIVVSFDSASGQIGLVAPALETRGGGKLKPMTATNGHLVYQGTFPKIYDGKGHVVNPAPVSRIEIDPKTGQIVSAS